ncbi:hypothetical protein HK405_002395 [Cladochytrium tenue]|nr:hypothetical protein HK405_002395 [Cladochytrium tenue]
MPGTHAAVVTVAVGAPLELHQVPTRDPRGREVRVRVEWVASTPLDLHRADGGLLVSHPSIIGSGAAGTVVAVGPDVKSLAVGDKVFGFAFEEQEHRSQQEFTTVPDYTLGRVPANLQPQEAVTVPCNLVTAFHTITADLGLPLPWPLPLPLPVPAPAAADAPILIWGAASSVGLYTIQLLHLYGYRALLAVASPRHHDALRTLGAAWTGDYRDPSIVAQVRAAAASLAAAAPPTPQAGAAPVPAVPYIVDCIGSLSGSVERVAEIADPGARVAIMLPVVVEEYGEGLKPVYSMDAAGSTKSWKESVVVIGTRTHNYMQNEFFKYHLQSEIVPSLLERGLITPNKLRIVEGRNLLERAENALAILRRKEASAEKLVWRVAEE